MKKKISIFLSCVFVALVAILFAVNNYYASKEVITNEERSYLNTANMMSMMYETASGSGEYMIASDNTWPQEGYVFNERLSGCENGGKLTWDDERKTVTLSTNVSEKCYLYFDVEPSLADVCSREANLSNCIVDFHAIAGNGVDDIYYHDANLVNGAQDNSYRFSGANPNNYVCFGATGTDCQNTNNQYRIIGVFNNQIKLIKATSYGNYVWDTDNNTWDASTKPDIYTTLNETYYNALIPEWQNIIADATWQVGGMSFSNTNTAKQYYDYEVGTGQNGYEETMKIGLMYVSDYGFAADPNNWTIALLDYGTSTAAIENWLYIGLHEWTISRDTEYRSFAFTIGDTGYASANGVLNYMYIVRPVFYLTSTATISSGTGTSTDPFVLSIA